MIGAVGLYTLSRSSPSLAINGSYTVSGIVIGTAFSWAYSVKKESLTSVAEADVSKQFPKLVYILVSGTIVGSTFGSSRSVLLLTLLPICSLLVVIQVVKDAPIAWVIPQLMALFIVNPLTRFLNTGYFFGNGDLLVHTPNIQRVMETGTTGQYLVLYQQYPGYFFEIATVGHILGISGYSALELTGAIIYTVGLLLVYTLANRLSQSRLFGVSVALAFLAIRQFHWYANYLFPQAYVVILILVFLTAARIQNEIHFSSASRLKAILGGALLIVTIVSAMYIHHLGILVSLFVLFFLVISEKVTLWQIPNHRNIGILGRGYAALLFLIGLSRWTTTGSGFLFPLSEYTFLLFGIGSRVSLFFSDGGTGGSALTEIGSASLSSGVLNMIVYPPFIYFISLVSVLVIGVCVLLVSYRDLSDALPYILTGAILSPLVLPTPISIKSINRLRLVFLLAFVFFLGCGVYGLIQLSRSNHSSLRVASIVLLVGLIVAGPIASSSITLMGPIQSQSEFSTTEYKQIEATSEFVGETDIRTDWLTGVTINHFRERDLAYSGINVSAEGLSFDSGTLIFRETWTDYRVSYRDTNSKLFSRFVITRGYIHELEQRKNKIYSSGGVGALKNTDANNTNSS
ncbi:hypothetical protein [Haloarcula sp. 1CSR25-25]|uniref:hypothetical protein n=1 Tax=Haloarcula sp. 1CSR25-25 TaxID=2862545 RepID=UPI00289530B9|nr:hypothetical protein [Haloarcula sp. 1CSR25-25]MDT3435563.1 hypothetical protein [Haloarcula sp. 1CSR25-25]